MKFRSTALNGDIEVFYMEVGSELYLQMPEGKLVSTYIPVEIIKSMLSDDSSIELLESIIYFIRCKVILLQRLSQESMAVETDYLFSTLDGSIDYTLEFLRNVFNKPKEGDTIFTKRGKSSGIRIVGLDKVRENHALTYFTPNHGSLRYLYMTDTSIRISSVDTGDNTSIYVRDIRNKVSPLFYAYESGTSLVKSLLECILLRSFLKESEGDPTDLLADANVQDFIGNLMMDMKLTENAKPMRYWFRPETATIVVAKHIKARDAYIRQNRLPNGGYVEMTKEELEKVVRGGSYE